MSRRSRSQGSAPLAVMPSSLNSFLDRPSFATSFTNMDRFMSATVDGGRASTKDAVFASLFAETSGSISSKAPAKVEKSRARESTRVLELGDHPDLPHVDHLHAFSPSVARRAAAESALEAIRLQKLEDEKYCTPTWLRGKGGVVDAVSGSGAVEVGGSVDQRVGNNDAGRIVSRPHLPHIDDSLVLFNDAFAYHGVHPPKVVSVTPPTGWQPGLKGVDRILTAQQRRDIYEFEASHNSAKKFVRNSNTNQVRRMLLMKKEWPNGVLGVESPHTEGTVVYADEQQARREMSQRREEHDRRRRENLHKKLASTAVRGFDLLQDVPSTAFSSHPDFSDKKDFQALDHTSRPNLDTQTRVFGQTDHSRFNQTRAERLSGLQSDGRNFDIITGRALHVPISMEEGRGGGNLRHTHPSMIHDIMEKEGHKKAPYK